MRVSAPQFADSNLAVPLRRKVESKPGFYQCRRVTRWVGRSDARQVCRISKPGRVKSRHPPKSTSLSLCSIPDAMRKWKPWRVRWLIAALIPELHGRLWAYPSRHKGKI